MPVRRTVASDCADPSTSHYHNAPDNLGYVGINGTQPSFTHQISFHTRASCSGSDSMILVKFCVFILKLRPKNLIINEVFAVPVLVTADTIREHCRLVIVRFLAELSCMCLSGNPIECGHAFAAIHRFGLFGASCGSHG